MHFSPLRPKATMKICQTCDQLLAENMVTCPSCGDEVGAGRKQIDEYTILEVLQEGHASIMCRAVGENRGAPVLIRMYKDQVGIDEEVANRLQHRMEQLNQLPDDGFIRHFEITRSSDGIWYRVSEWIDGEKWSRIFSSGILKDNQIAFDLFHQIACSLQVLHESGHFIPHLVLSDIIIIKENSKKLKAKIDYKLSRFLGHSPEIPGTMLNDILQCHPDIVNNKPLDFRSDIWSLGKIFIELLTTSLGGCPTTAQINNLNIPRNAKTLLKIMLSPDPSMRPQTMKEVADALQKLRKQKPEKRKQDKKEKSSIVFPEIQKLRFRVWSLTSLLIVLLLGGISGLFYFTTSNNHIETDFQEYANRYSNSVAFVLVDYFLLQNGNRIYQKRTEGTAFLVDERGYLITNRHVAAPWLLDRDLFIMIEQLKRQEFEVHFDYRMYLWFEGQKAYKRIPSLGDSGELNDIYYIESAYRSDGKPRVEIAGIERSIVRQGYLSRSPLKDDFSVLKIDEVPPGLEPIPLDKSLKIEDVKKLSPVITIGFPLGSRAQANRVNVSVTRGNVRRVFEEMIQVDTSIYKGNSGGPIIDERGKVIGIATGIMFDTSLGMIPVMTPLSDIGMVLPITKTAAFLEDLKQGKPKWNGLMDLSIDKKIENLKHYALRGDWEIATRMVTNELKFSLDPNLITAAGMIHFSSGDYVGAKHFFDQVISMDDQHHEVRLMLYLIDWLTGDFIDSRHRQPLLDFDWRSDGELFGFLVRILENRVDPDSALRAWYTLNEKSWISYISAFVQHKKHRPQEAIKLLRTAAYASGKRLWIHYLILAELQHVHEQQILLTRDKRGKNRLEKEIERFHSSLEQALGERDQKLEEITPLFSRLLMPSVRINDKISILKRMREIDADNKDILISLAFFHAMEGDWQETVKYINEFLKKGGRENKSYLSIRVLELGVLNNLGLSSDDLESKTLEILNQIEDSWYRAILKMMSSKTSESVMMERAAQHPEYLLTTHFALGFLSEGNREFDKAVYHYKEALSTYLEGWWEYEFAKARIRKIRDEQITQSN